MEVSQERRQVPLREAVVSILILQQADARTIIVFFHRATVKRLRHAQDLRWRNQDRAGVNHVKIDDFVILAVFRNKRGQEQWSARDRRYE